MATSLAKALNQAAAALRSSPNRRAAKELLQRVETDGLRLKEEEQKELVALITGLVREIEYAQTEARDNLRQTGRTIAAAMRHNARTPHYR